MKHPLQPASHSGAVLRRTRRVDGVKVNVHCARRLRALHTADADRSCPRDTDGTVRGCPRRPGARRRRRGVAYLPPRRSERRRPRSGAVLEVSPVAPRDAPVAVRNGSESKKKRPTAVIPGKGLVEPPRTAPGPRRVPRGRLEKGPSRRRGSQLSINIELFIHSLIRGGGVGGGLVLRLVPR